MKSPFLTLQAGVMLISLFASTAMAHQGRAYFHNDATFSIDVFMLDYGNEKITVPPSGDNNHETPGATTIIGFLVTSNVTLTIGGGYCWGAGQETINDTLYQKIKIHDKGRMAFTGTQTASNGYTSAGPMPPIQDLTITCGPH